MRHCLGSIVRLSLALSLGLAANVGMADTTDSSLAMLRRLSGFLQAHCIDCHGSETQEGELRFDTLGVDLNANATARLWERIFEQVQFSEMPPDESDQPSSVARQAFLTALDRELATHGRGMALKDKLIRPEYGNYVSHDLLFNGEINSAPYTPARLWRLRPDIYDRLWGSRFGQQHRLSVKIGDPVKPDDKNAVQHGPHQGRKITYRYFAQERFANPFYEFAHHAAGFTDYATIPADQASLETLLLNAETMAEILTQGIPVSIQTEVKTQDSRRGNNHGGFVGGDVSNRVDRRGVVPDAFARLMATDDLPQKEDFAAALDVAFNLLLRRIPSESEVEHYWTNLFKRNAEYGNMTALQSVLVYITLSPEFVYRMETGLGEVDEHGRRMLSPHELVYALHYAFFDSPPFGTREAAGQDVYKPVDEPLVNKAMTSTRRKTDRKDSLLVDLMRAGELTTRDEVETAVRQILEWREKNPRPNHNKPVQSTTRPRVLQFFREFFGYHKASTVFKDVEQFTKREEFRHFGKQTAMKLAYDTDALILDVLHEDRNVLEELLTTDRVAVSYWNGNFNEEQVARAGGKKKYGLIHHLQAYNLNPYEAPPAAEQPYRLPEQRCGVLTQPSWLVAHSGNFDNVRRHRWLPGRLGILSLSSSLPGAFSSTALLNGTLG